MYFGHNSILVMDRAVVDRGDGAANFVCQYLRIYHNIFGLVSTHLKTLPRLFTTGLGKRLLL